MANNRLSIFSVLYTILLKGQNLDNNLTLSVPESLIFSIKTDCGSQKVSKIFMQKRVILISLMWILSLAGCSDVSVVDQEIEELSGFRSEQIFTYRINTLPDELPEQGTVDFLINWVTERILVGEELLEYDGRGNLLFREVVDLEEDFIYREIYRYSEDLTLLEIETTINGESCQNCLPDRIERVLNVLVQPVLEQSFQDGRFLHEDVIQYNQPGEIFSIRRNLSPGHNELFTEFFRYIPKDPRTNIIRDRRKFFKGEDRVRTTQYGYDINGYPARVTVLEELPIRQIVSEDRYITLLGDNNRNWISRIKNRQWLEERLIEYF